MTRRILLIALLLAAAPGCQASNPVSVHIRQVGLGGFVMGNGAPTWIQVELRNATEQALALQLVVAEVGLEYEVRPMTGARTFAMNLAAGEQRTVDVPLPVFPGNHLVIWAQARGDHGQPLGSDARRVPEKSDGQLLALLCGHPDLCRSMQQSILLTGSTEEQTRKSRTLRMALLTGAAPAWWAYSSVNTVVLALPVGQLSESQRDALELYLRRGGRLVLVEDQLGDTPASARGASPAGKGQARFLDAYRAGPPDGRVQPVGDGKLVRMKSAGSGDFSDLFRSLGFGEGTPEDVRRLAERFNRGDMGRREGNENGWLESRLGTSFRFPSFREMLLWMTVYVLLVGVLNFFILRRFGRPEWGWVSIPVIAVLFSVSLYAVSARNRPRNFGLDEMVVYRMDNHSALATSEVTIRVSAPKRATVQPSVPADLVVSGGQRFAYEMEASIAYARNFQGALDTLQHGDTWETAFLIRKWSFRDLSFLGQHRFQGTIYRDGQGRLHNETGVSYQQAMVVDHEDVFLLGYFPAGAVANLAHVPRRSYKKETGRRLGYAESYPGPPFDIRKSNDGWSLGETDARRFEDEFQKLGAQPFSLEELIRGWPPDGDQVFYETKAVFFGLSDQALPGVALLERQPDRRSHSLTIVTFLEWP